MTDTAKRLSGPTALTTGAVTQYTVPASTTTIVRSIHVVSSAGSAILFTLGINGVAVANAIYYTFAVPASGTLDWSGFLVLNAADTLQALASAGASLTLTISGVEVTA